MLQLPKSDDPEIHFHSDVRVVDSFDHARSRNVHLLDIHCVSVFPENAGRFSIATRGNC